MENRLSRFWQRVNDYGNDEMSEYFSHSRSYHRHFQGYAEQRTPGKNGNRTKIERIYVADYYRYAETDARWRLRKIMYVFLSALMFMCSVAADSQPAAINHLPAAGIVQVLSFIPIIYFLYRLILQVSAPRQMTIGQREASSDGFQNAALICTCVLLLAAVVMPTEKWIVYRSLDGTDLGITGLKLLSMITAAALYFTERARKISRVPNETIAPAGANEIW